MIVSERINSTLYTTKNDSILSNDAAFFNDEVRHLPDRWLKAVESNDEYVDRTCFTSFEQTFDFTEKFGFIYTRDT